MSKPKLVKTSSAKSMHELASNFTLNNQIFMETLKAIELNALQGSYFLNSPDGTFELIAQLKEKLEEEGFKCEMITPEIGEEAYKYWLKITW